VEDRSMSGGTWESVTGSGVCGDRVGLEELGAREGDCGGLGEEIAR